MAWWRKNMVPIKKGQRWRKRKTVHGKEFIVVIIGTAHHDGVKTICSDGNTHTFGRRILYQFYDLIDDKHGKSSEAQS